MSRLWNCITDAEGQVSKNAWATDTDSEDKTELTLKAERKGRKG